MTTRKRNRHSLAHRRRKTGWVWIRMRTAAGTILIVNRKSGRSRDTKRITTLMMVVMTRVSPILRKNYRRTTSIAIAVIKITMKVPSWVPRREKIKKTIKKNKRKRLLLSMRMSSPNTVTKTLRSRNSLKSKNLLLFKRSRKRNCSCLTSTTKARNYRKWKRRSSSLKEGNKKGLSNSSSATPKTLHQKRNTSRCLYNHAHSWTKTRPTKNAKPFNPPPKNQKNQLNNPHRPSNNINVKSQRKTSHTWHMSWSPAIKNLW